MKEEPIQKPLVLELDEAKADLVNVINTALTIRRIPCWALEPIIGDIYRQIKVGSQKELDTAKLQIKNQTKQTIDKKEE